MKVKLNPEEAMMAVAVGARRECKNIYSNFKDLSPPKNGKRDGWSNMITGACAECAVAKGLGLYWSGVLNSARDSFACPDIGIDLEARCANSGNLYIKQRDIDSRRLIYVIGELPEFELIGWVNIVEVKQGPFDEYGYSKIRSSQMRPLSTLNELLQTVDAADLTG